MFDQEQALPALVIRGKKIRVPIIQGGMGVGVSLYPLASAVAREGGLGIISSACLDRLLTKRTGKKYSTYEASYEEVSRSKAAGGFVGINIMNALVRDFNDSVRGALDAGADAIIAGAGLPLTLPAIQPQKDTALIPIVSSSRALDIICKKWEKIGSRPDAVVLEGPLAGGHLGFKIDQIDLDCNRLENLFAPVKEMARKYGDFPVIVAGGIYTHEDILKFFKMGADGVQMGTRFLATEESSATDDYKRAVVGAREEDIIVAHDPGSPCGLPFRVIKQSPMYVSALKRLRKPKCDKGYVLLKDRDGKFSICPAKESNEHHFCICNGLLSSAGYNPDREEPLYTVGTNASRVDKIVPVKALMDELTGKVLVPSA
ncbi:MAG TPA: nitronate monooxygenase family protein [Thermodesulfovibrionales bacterium]|jgi:nitronate monooxygenase|nr:nitronate monooxygenase family protein [Thermodesulfovibrionales bacterium]